jgi:type IV pilus biogenesis protein CpaD/CtpE
MRLSSFFTGIIALAGALAVSACDVTTPSTLETGSIRVQEDMKTAQLDARRVDKAKIAILADDYRINGRGGARLVMPYLSGHPLEEVSARTRGRAYQDALSGKGIAPVTVDYIAVDDPKLADAAVLSYKAQVALPPEGCRSLTGHDGGDTMEGLRHYRMGCETQTAISKMIVQPSDLQGRGGLGDTPARREGAVVEDYTAGKKNAPLQGMSASSVGGGN